MSWMQQIMDGSQVIKLITTILFMISQIKDSSGFRIGMIGLLEDLLLMLGQLIKILV